MPSNSPKRCHHIKMNGTQCGSPAMRTERFCFFHLNTSPLNCEVRSHDLRPDENFVLPVLEDATSIQLAISQVMAYLLRDYIDVKKARVLLTACKLAAYNLKRMDTEKPTPTQMLVDVTTIPTTPMGAALWSETDESHDLDEKLSVPPTQNAQPTGKTRRRTSEAAQRAEGKAFGARLKESLKRAAEQAQNEPPADKSTDSLPPGTIQACQRRKEYVV